MSATLLSSKKTYGGLTQQWSHESSVLGNNAEGTPVVMKFSVFLPPNVSEPVPVLYWLSGLTCTDENFITKVSGQRVAAQVGIALVCPDTSPRGCKIEGEEDSWDFGTGAGFYINATAEKWKNNYNMFRYVTEELPAVIKANFPSINTENAGISGHSMGGHGALVCALKRPDLYKSVSAFAPISNPIKCPWGIKAFSNYLSSEEEWKDWDASHLITNFHERSAGKSLDILIDQGDADDFLLKGQLLPENIIAAHASSQSGCKLTVRNQEQYDHSYYFVCTFFEDHVQHHLKYLKN